MKHYKTVTKVSYIYYPLYSYISSQQNCLMNHINFTLHYMVHLGG